jgi:hypothetical protein
MGKASTIALAAYQNGCLLAMVPTNSTMHQTWSLSNLDGVFLQPTSTSSTPSTSSTIKGLFFFSFKFAP